MRDKRRLAGVLRRTKRKIEIVRNVRESQALIRTGEEVAGNEEYDD